MSERRARYYSTVGGIIESRVAPISVRFRFRRRHRQFHRPKFAFASLSNRKSNPFVLGRLEAGAHFCAPQICRNERLRHCHLFCAVAKFCSRLFAALALLARFLLPQPAAGPSPPLGSTSIRLFYHAVPPFNLIFKFEFHSTFPSFSLRCVALRCVGFSSNRTCV